MLTHRMLLVAALGATLGAVPGIASAQGSWLATPPSLETDYTQLRLDSDGPSLNAGGVGARLMWRAAPDGAAPGGAGVRSALARRLDLGVYGSYAPEHGYADGLRFAVGAFGAVADVRPFAAPLGGRVDPFVSLATGWLNTRVSAAVAPDPSPLLGKSHVAFALTPGVGARVRLTRRVGLEGDFTDAVTFLGATRNNLGFGAGLRLML